MKTIFTALAIIAFIGGTAAALSASGQNNSTGGVSIPSDQTKLECSDCKIPSPQN